MGGHEGHRHATHREGGMDAHGYGVKLEIRSAKPLAPSVIEELLKRLVATVGERCLQAGARAIGHIKCCLKTERGYAKADIVRLRDGPFSEIRLGSAISGGSLVINSILLGLDEVNLEEITMGSTSDILSEYGITIAGKEAGC